MDTDEYKRKLTELLDVHGPEVIMCFVADYLGWSVAIPGELEEPVHGMVIGKQEFITMVFGVRPEDLKSPDRSLMN